MNKTNQWILDLKPGDEVVVRRWGGMGEMYILAKVARVTKTQIAVENSQQRFDKRGLMRGGSVWSSAVLVQATDCLVSEIKTKERHRLLSKKLSSHKWESETVDRLESVWKCIRNERE